MNNVLIFLILLFLSIFIFYAFGRIVQKRFSLASEHFLLSIPVGFVAYFGITQIIYLPFIFFEASQIVFAFLELGKIILILY